MTDADYMQRAIDLAKQGQGWVSPNPMVGAVLVKNGRIIGEGYHQACGKPHAERNALAACAESPQGATLYVTLEPCCHHGRTPPCTDAILQAGIAKVIIGSNDPNPNVQDSTDILKTAGIVVKKGVLQKECDALNPVFFHYIQTREPYLVLKYAMTLDGKTATSTGASKWITGKAAREHVHQLRHRYSGIMVGIGTVLQDDPLLTCRLEHGKNPIRIICDSHLRIPLESQICRTAASVPTIVATATDNADKIAALQARKITVLTVPGKNGQVDIPSLMQKLGQLEIDSILLEGGARLNDSVLQAGIVQEVYAYIAPKIFGGEHAKTPVGGIGCLSPADSYTFGAPTIHPFGGDLLLHYKAERGQP